MSNNDLHIDESTHEPALTTADRFKYAAFSLFLGFLLVNIIGFWMFPGIGIGGLYTFSSVHPSVGIMGDTVHIVLWCFLALCALFGWFNGKHFTNRLSGYIDWWKFW